MYVSFRDLPDYLKDYDETSDREVYKQLIRIALSDLPTRKELKRIGFKLPPENIFGLPAHLKHWERSFRHLKVHLTSTDDMEKVFPEMALLSQEEKDVLLLYYKNEQEWSIQVKSDTSVVPLSTISVKTRSSVRKSANTIPYQELDISDEPMDLYHIVLGEQLVLILLGLGV